MRPDSLWTHHSWLLHVVCFPTARSHMDGVYYVCAGLANGQVAFYDQYLLNVSDGDCDQSPSSPPPLFILFSTSPLPRTHTHAHARTHMHACMHAHTCTHACTHARTRTHAHMHAHTHTHADTWSQRPCSNHWRWSGQRGEATPQPAVCLLWLRHCRDQDIRSFCDQEMAGCRRVSERVHVEGREGGWNEGRGENE